MTQAIRYLLLLGILALGAGLRFWDTNWDQNHHLHPDERFLTMVANDSRIPNSFTDYLNPQISTLVPYNINFKYFTYGALPLTITKLVAVATGYDNYDDIVLVGRMLAATFDTLTIIFVYLLAARLFSPNIGVASALVYALTVLAIQHSHFLVVDPFGVSFFMLAAVLTYCAGTPLFAGLAFGAAVGCKVSLVMQFPVLLVLVALQSRKLRSIASQAFFLIIGTYVGLRVSDPKFFAASSWLNPTINPIFVENLREVSRLSAYSEHPWPPGVQWLSKTPLLFTLQNFFLFGFGIVSTWLAGWGVWMNRTTPKVLLITAWCATILLYCGSQFLQTMRYAYPIYPLVAILAGLGFMTIAQQYRDHRQRWVVAFVLSALLSLWPAAFMSIYRGEHTRVEASRWILDNLPSDSKIAVEHWDDSLPLRLPHKDFKIKFIELPVFESDSPEKLAILRAKTAEANAIVFSSNRGWGSIMPLTNKFPLTIEWYKEIFSGSGDFIERHRVTRWPSLFGVEFPCEMADEAFSVYDHPEVRIFIRKGLARRNQR